MRKSDQSPSASGVLAQEVQERRLMKIAIPHWQSRVSPVCDEARLFLVVQLIDGREVARSELALAPPGNDLIGRVAQLRRWGVDVVICGAVSQELETVLQGAGIQVVARVCGDVEEVLQAYQTGRLDQQRFLLPGCVRRRCRRAQGRCGHDSLP
jgi:predicted Fe-Mo cluster-binding NifX family protein